MTYQDRTERMTSLALVLLGLGLLCTAFKIHNPTWQAVFSGIGTSAVAAAIATWFSVFQRRIPGATERQFLALFGRNATSRNERGRILIQADDVESLIGDLDVESTGAKPAVKAALYRTKNNRLYKARKVVNARDAEAARVIRNGFRADKFPTPELIIIEHKRKKKDQDKTEKDGVVDDFTEHSSAPYVISLGLGWTDTTIALCNNIHVTGGGFYIDRSSKHGDAVTIRGDHILAEYEEFDQIEVPKDEVQKEYQSDRRYYRLYPKPWCHEAWLKPNQCDPGTKCEVCGLTGCRANDYALIMRHTHVESNKTQVRFVLAGFTEDGTVAAARYLVNRQSYLYDIYKRFKDERVNKTGDFVAIITGPAHTTDLWGDPPLIAFSKAPNTSLPSQPEPKSSWSKVTSAAGRLIDRVLGKETDSREL